VAGYKLMPCREGSDNVGTTVIWDGSNFRGSIFSDFPVSISPNPLGVINDEIFGMKEGSVLNRMWQMQIHRATGAPVFPQPAISGLATAGAFRQWLARPFVYAQNIQHDFKQIATTQNSDFFVLTTARIVQPEGDLDIGDGSAFFPFTAKASGSDTSKQYLGRLLAVTSGVEKQLQITEYWGPIDTVPSHVGSV